MDELAEFLGGVATYTPEQEFAIIEKARKLSIEQWDERAIQNTRNRYKRYIRNVNFDGNPGIKEDMKFFIDMTSSPREYNQFDTYRLARKIDFGIYLIIMQEDI